MADEEGFQATPLGMSVVSGFLVGVALTIFWDPRFSTMTGIGVALAGYILAIAWLPLRVQWVAIGLALVSPVLWRVTLTTTPRKYEPPPVINEGMVGTELTRLEVCTVPNESTEIEADIRITVLSPDPPSFDRIEALYIGPWDDTVTFTPRARNGQGYHWLEGDSDIAEARLRTYLLPGENSPLWIRLMRDDSLVAGPYTFPFPQPTSQQVDSALRVAPRSVQGELLIRPCWEY